MADPYPNAVNDLSNLLNKQAPDNGGSNVIQWPSDPGPLPSPVPDPVPAPAPVQQQPQQLQRSLSPRRLHLPRRPSA